MALETLVEIDYRQLNPETLEAVIGAFVLREGTDYGMNEASLEAKMHSIRTQLEKGAVRLVFDLDADNCTILSESEFQANASRLRKKKVESENGD